MLGVFVIAASLIIVGGLIYSGRQTATGGVNTHQITRMDIELDFDSYASAAQDDADDVEWHVFYLGEQNDLSDLKDNNYFDCSGAYNNPLMLDPTDTTLRIDRGMQYIGEGTAYESFFCKANFYKLFQESSIEDNIQTDDVERVCADLGVVDADDGATEECTLEQEGKYLVVFREITGGEVGDVVGGAFVVEVPKTVSATAISRENVDDINDGTTNFRISYDYLSDAMAESQTTVFGSWDDDEDNSGTLDSSLNGWCDSSLTTSTSIDVEVEYGLRIDTDGYAIILDNPMGDGNSEKGYVVYTPYGENATSGTWQEYNTGDFTGDVAYSTGNVNTKQLIFQAETQGSCTHTLVSSSGSDAVADGDEKLYDCFGGKNIKNKGAEVTLKLKVDEVLVDYDDSVTANDEEVNCNSGSSGEDLFDVDWIGVVDSTDRMGATLSP